MIPSSIGGARQYRSLIAFDIKFNRFSEALSHFYLFCISNSLGLVGQYRGLIIDLFAKSHRSIDFVRQYRSFAIFTSNLIGLVRQYRGFITFHIKLSRISETVSQFVNFLYQILYIAVCDFPLSDLVGLVRQYRGSVTFRIRSNRFSETVSQFDNCSYQIW